MKFTAHAKQDGPKGDKFLKVKDGESVKCVFRGEIFEYFVKWENGKSIIVGPNEGKVRFRVNVAVPEGSAFKMKIFEFGRPVYDQLEMLNKNYGDVTKIKITIARKGEKLETTYMLMPLVHEPLAPPVMAKIEAIPLNNLGGNKKEEPKVDAFSDVPFPSEMPNYPSVDDDDSDHLPF